MLHCNCGHCTKTSRYCDIENWIMGMAKESDAVLISVYQMTSDTLISFFLEEEIPVSIIVDMKITQKQTHTAGLEQLPDRIPRELLFGVPQQGLPTKLPAASALRKEGKYPNYHLKHFLFCKIREARGIPPYLVPWRDLRGSWNATRNASRSNNNMTLHPLAQDAIHNMHTFLETLRLAEPIRTLGMPGYPEILNTTNRVRGWVEESYQKR